MSHSSAIANVVEAPPASGRLRSRTFRPDIEGLRAVAVGLVMAYHAGVRWIPGGFVGVDVFFVISGFLITGLLIREAERSGTISLRGFYARRARRILPAAVLALLGAVAVAWWVLPRTQRRIFGVDIVSAALYVVNWRLAGRSVDYLAEDVVPSPVEHFWSLAVEEQFYLIWPLLLLVALVVARKLNLPLRPTLTVALLVIVLPSLTWSVYYTHVSSASAFFVTPTRLWELGIGALIAVARPLWVRIPRAWSVVLALAGAGAVVYAGLQVNGQAEWPGSLALIPVLGAAAIIASGCRRPAPVIGRALSWAPMVWIGGLSYSLYLWHWIVLSAGSAGHQVSTLHGIVLVAASFVPAWLSHRLVENPIRFSARLSRSPALALALGANLSMVAAIAGLVVALPTLSAPSTVAVGSSDVSGPVGAQVVLDHPAAAVNLWRVNTTATLIPAPDQAAADIPAAYGDGCQASQTAVTPVECSYGDVTSKTKVVLAGDSKILQWVDVLSAIAADRGWQLVTLTKSACAFTGVTQAHNEKPYDSCTRWNEAVLRRILAMKPSLVLTSQDASGALVGGESSEDAMVTGLASWWRTLQKAAIPVVVITDNAPPKGNAYECVARSPDHLSACAFKPSFTTASVQKRAADRVGGIGMIDVSDVICPGNHCPAVMGGVLVYRQGSHLTRTFTMTMRPVLESRLDDALIMLARR